MNGISKLRLAAGAAAFWVAVLSAFWLGTRYNRDSKEGGTASADGPEVSNTRGMADAGGGPGVTAGKSATRQPSGANPPVAPGPTPGGTAGSPASPRTGALRDPDAAGAEPEDLGARDLAPGEIVELNYEFKSEESRRHFESDQKARWEARKAQEIVRVSEYLAQELKLDGGQADRLRRLLEEESRRRVDVVTDLVEGRIDQTDFRRRVDSIRESARRELDSLLTPEQLAHYKTLSPRKKVLLDSTIQGH